MPDSEDLELRLGDRILALRNDRKIGTVTGTDHDPVHSETSDGDRLAT